MANDVFSKRMSLDSWDRYSLAIEKPYVFSDATQTAIGYVVKNKAYLVYSPVDVYYALTEPEELGPASDISVAYDARWREEADGRYTIYTIGSPYIALVNTANKLTVQQGIGGVKTPIDSNVEKCCLVRGWKHITDYTIDQGLVAFYIKGGNLWSRAYVQTGPSTYRWDTAQRHAELGGGIIDVKVRRTSDYRLMIQVRTAEGNKMALTDRVWPGQAFKSETITLPVFTELTVSSSLRTIQSIMINASTERMTAMIGNPEVTSINTRYTPINESIIRCDRFFEEEQRIVIRMNNDISINGDISKYLVGTDAEGKIIPIIEIKKAVFGLELLCVGLEYFTGPITFTYSGQVLFELSLPEIINKTPVSPFTVECSLEGIIPQEPNPPIITSVSNHTGRYVDIEFDKKVLSTEGLLLNSLKALTLTFPEPMFSGGPTRTTTLVSTAIEVLSDTKLRIDVEPYFFNNALYDIVFKYDAGRGSLFGEQGPVQTAEKLISPVDLEPKPQPGGEERISLGLEWTTSKLRWVSRQDVSAKTESIILPEFTSYTWQGTLNVSGTIKP